MVKNYGELEHTNSRQYHQTVPRGKGPFEVATSGKDKESVQPERAIQDGHLPRRNGSEIAYGTDAQSHCRSTGYSSGGTSCLIFFAVFFVLVNTKNSVRRHARIFAAGDKETMRLQLDLIDPSPYQARRGFDNAKLGELASNMEANGLIHPICVRPNNGRYELLAGERRVRAASLLQWREIRAEIRDVDDLQARKIVLSENIHRVDLTPVEEIEAFGQWIDVLMSEDDAYGGISKPPMERLAWVLMKLHSDYVHKTDHFVNKFINKIESAFATLPRKLDWRSFYVNDLKPYLKMDDEVKALAAEHKLSRSQAKSLQELKCKAPTEFSNIAKTGKTTVIPSTKRKRGRHKPKDEKPEQHDISEVSSREIENIARSATKPKEADLLDGTVIKQPVKQPSDVRILNMSSENMDGWVVDVAGDKFMIHDNSVHLVVTSPPYNIGADYDGYSDSAPWEEYIELLRSVFGQCHKKLVPGGRMAVNVPKVSSISGQVPRFPILDVSSLLIDCGFCIREIITWVKANMEDVEGSIKASGHLSTAWGSWRSPSNPVLRSITEHIIVAHKREAALKGDHTDITDQEFLDWTYDIWFVPAARSRDHPSVFPVELPRRLIKLYSYAGQTILDPFMGIGTTGVACCDRKFVGFEISESYCKTALERINESRLSYPQ